MRDVAGLPSPATRWFNKPIGGMGYSPRILTASDGSYQLVDTDGCGVFKRLGASGPWRQVCRRDNLPPELLDFKPSIGESGGGWNTCSAPSDPSRVYISYAHRWMTSDDAAETLNLATAVPQMMMNSNAQGSGSYQRVAFNKAQVDPINKDVFFWFAEGEGLNFTDDGLASYSKITTIPDAVSPYSRSQPDDRYGMLVADPNSTPSGGRTTVWYAAVIGRGIYMSVDCGVTWTQIHATLLYPANIQLNPDGTKLYVFDFISTGGNVSGQNVYVYDVAGESWTGPIGGQHIRYVAWDPDDATHQTLIGMKPFLMSTNGGTSWTDKAGATSDPYHNYMQSTSMHMIVTAHEHGWDMTNSGGCVYGDEFFVGTGYGIVKIDLANWREANPDTGPALVVYEDTAAIENLVVQHCASTPLGEEIGICQDKALIEFPDDGSPPVASWPEETLTNGYALDWDGANPGWLAAQITKNGITASFRPGVGEEWQEFPGQSSTAGSICVVEAGHVVIFPGANGWPQVGIQDGADWDWTDCVFDGFAKRASPPSTNTSGWGFGTIENDRFIVCNDKDNPLVLYAFNYGSCDETADGATRIAQRAATRGLWKSTDGGFNFTRVFVGAITHALIEGFHFQLRHSAGALWATAGQNGSGGAFEAHPDQPFKRSLDGGLSFEDMPEISCVNFFGFGAAAPGFTDPALYVVAWRDGERGVFRCCNPNEPDIDDCVWQTLTRTDSPWTEACIDGNKLEFGAGLVGYGGNSFEGFAGDYRFRLV